MNIIAFTGLTASGKSTALEILKDAKTHTIDLGEIIRNSYKDSILHNEIDIISFSINSHMNYGKLWSISKAYLDFKNYNNIVISGIRFPEQVDFLKAISTNFKLVYIDSTKENRLNRFLERKRSDFNSNKESFETKEKLELEIWQIEKVLVAADIKIKNNRTLVDFKNSILKLLPF